MKSRPTLPDSGVRIDNRLTMSLRHRSRNRNTLSLAALALLGGVSFVMTFLSMFSPAYHVPVVLAVTVAATLFFCWHASAPKGKHITLIVFLFLYTIVLYREKMRAVSGLACLMNAVYQTVNQTDWLYFEPIPEYSAEGSTTFLLCMLLLPIMGLLGYAVMRYHNFLLSMLVTFPFVEIGFFFGIAPDHLPAITLFAFWCGMGAVQLASSGILQKNGAAGFMRKRDAFFPVSGMRFLLTERAGMTVAGTVLLVCLAADWTLGVMQYERPDSVKQMRKDFQTYASSVDLSDWKTFIPSFLKNKNHNMQQIEIELGKDDEQEFDNTLVSAVVFSDMPRSRIYLRYRTASVYNNSIWSSLDEDEFDAPIIDQFGALNCYPPEFLHYAVPMENRMDMTLYNASDTLAQCVPYGYLKSGSVLCKNDDIMMTQTGSYTIYGGIDYENLIMRTSFSAVTVRELLSQSNPGESSRLQALTDGHKEETVQMPYSPVFSQNAVKAALLSACGYTDFAREHYLTLPDMPETETIRSMYADLLQGFDAETASPKETVYELQLLRERLCSQVTYTLAPGKTPPDVDFVSWFLLENQQGYCMHYATAAVLLARMAGIPARYCDGYLVEPEQLQAIRQNEAFVYTAEILDSNAHAWCEVFIEGYGWLPFEFTYSYFTPPDLSPAEEVTETVPETEALPGTEPEETRTPEGHAGTTPSSGSHTETTAPTEAEETLLPQEYHFNWILPALLLVLWLVIGGFVLARHLALRKRERLFKQSDRQAAANAAWRWLLTLMQACGVDTGTHTLEQLAEDAEKCCTRYLDGMEIQDALAVGTKLRYSPHSITDKELRCLLQTAQTMAEGLYAASGILQKLRLKWFRHFL